MHQPAVAAREWLDRRLPATLALVTPQRLLMILMPLSLLALTNRVRIAMWLGLPLFVLLYFFYTFFLPHYIVITIPSVVLMIVLGVHVLEQVFPRRRHVVATLLYPMIAGLCISDWPGINRLVRDELFNPQSTLRVEQVIASIEHPAVVLFRYEPGYLGEDEPVYNIDAAWPDHARVVRAHDLGERNIELFRYYAAHQPQRIFYLYDRATGRLERLGRATDLADGDGG
jgi:hypothetical protein